MTADSRLPGRQLHYQELDESLTVWGNCVDGRVIVTGRGEAGHRWGRCYYHPDLGWTDAGTGNPVENRNQT